MGPGDFVECVQNRLPTTLPPRGLVVGRVYRVEEAGITPPDDECPGVRWVRLVGVKSHPRRWGFRAAWFRPLYKPAPGAFDHMLTTADGELVRP